MDLLWYLLVVLMLSFVSCAPAPPSNKMTYSAVSAAPASPSNIGTYSAVSGAPSTLSKNGNYSVTILNDSSLGDLMGTVHTWLKLKAPNKNTTYFSFSHAKGATWKIYPGVSSVDKWLMRRRPSETFRISISERQYDQMIRAIDEFYKMKPNYSLFPEAKDKSYNCVTATNYILKAGDIHILDGYLEPVFLGLRLANFRSILQKCIFRPNIFMFFGFAFHKTLCLFL